MLILQKDAGVLRTGGRGCQLRRPTVSCKLPLSRSRSTLQSLLNLFDRCGVALVLGTETFDSEGAEMIFTVVAYEVTELTRTVEAEPVEEAIALAYHGPDTDWSEWSETTLGTNGIEVVFAECGESVYDAGTRASMPTEDFEGAWQ